MKIGTGMLPELEGIGEDYFEQEKTQTLEEIIESAPRLDGVKDAGRVDELDEGIAIVGDQTSLNSIYSEVVDDEGDEFHIVK